MRWESGLRKLRNLPVFLKSVGEEIFFKACGFFFFSSQWKNKFDPVDKHKFFYVEKKEKHVIR